MKAAQQDDAPGAAANGAAAKATPLDHVLASYFSNEELVSLNMTVGISSYCVSSCRSNGTRALELLIAAALNSLCDRLIYVATSAKHWVTPKSRLPAAGL